MGEKNRILNMGGAMRSFLNKYDRLTIPETFMNNPCNLEKIVK